MISAFCKKAKAIIALFSLNEIHNFIVYVYFRSQIMAYASSKIHELFMKKIQIKFKNS